MLRRRRVQVLIVIASVIVVVAASLFLVPAQWAGKLVPGESVVDSDAVAFRPGKAVSTTSRVSVERINTFDPAGEILLTTVAVDDDVTVIEWIESSLSNSVDLRSRESVYGDRTTIEQRERNRLLMDESKDSAVVAALEHLGVDVVEATGVAFVEVVEGGPAAGVLNSGEVIVAIDGEPVSSLRSLLELLADRSPDTVAVITLEDLQSSQRRDVSVVLGDHPDPEREGGFIGISGITERLRYNELPFDVEISSGSVGGPSAGLAFSLAVLELLTPGELTGGRKVAVTGSIRIDGVVGDVGGVAQKAAAAQSAGAELFIVPAESATVAESASGSMPVVGVESLDEALEALASLGGEVRDLALPSQTELGLSDL